MPCWDFCHTWEAVGYTVISAPCFQPECGCLCCDPLPAWSLSSGGSSGWQSILKQGICITWSCSAKLIGKSLFQEPFPSLAVSEASLCGASASNGVEICKYVPLYCRWVRAPRWMTNSSWEKCVPFSLAEAVIPPSQPFSFSFGSEALEWMAV